MDSYCLVHLSCFGYTPSINGSNVAVGYQVIGVPGAPLKFQVAAGQVGIPTEASYEVLTRTMKLYCVCVGVLESWDSGLLLRSLT